MKTKLLLILMIVGLISNAQSLMTVSEVFDFEIGDEFHYISQLPNETPNADRRTIIDKDFSANNDSIFYTIALNNYATTYEEYPEPHLEYYFYQDTIIKYFTNLDSSIFYYNGCLPYDTLIEYSYCDSLINGFYCYVGEFEPDFYINEYGKGIGQVYEYAVYGESGGWPEIDKKLFYYKKSNGECGSPDIITSIGKTETDDELLVYPNPANDFIQIEINNNNSKILIIQVYDSKGKLLQTTNIDENKLDLTKFISGLYVLKVQIENRVITRKLIIQ